MNNYSSSQTLGISSSNLEFFKKEIQNFPKKKAWKIKKIEIFSEKLKDNKILNFENNKNTLFYMIKTPEDDRFLQDPTFQAKVKNSMRIDDVDFTQYDIIFMSGGWGAAYDLGYSDVLAKKISEAYYAQTPVIGGVCHGVLGLINAKDRDGNLLIANRKMTGVSDKQIKELGISMTPQHPEAELRKAGALYESNSAFRDFFATHVVVDDEQRFVTGQNQNSGHATAQAMMAVVKNQTNDNQ